MNSLALSILLIASVAEPIAKTPPEGVLPTGSGRKPLNFDIETGTLKDWTTEGNAFADQPIEGYQARNDSIAVTIKTHQPRQNRTRIGRAF